MTPPTRYIRFPNAEWIPQRLVDLLVLLVSRLALAGTGSGAAAAAGGSLALRRVAQKTLGSAAAGVSGTFLTLYRLSF